MEIVSATGLMDQVFLRCVEDCYEPIMLTDSAGRLIYVNPAWVLTYGYQKEEALGKTPRLLRSEGQDENFYRQMWKVILDPQVGFWRGEVVNRAKDGHLVPVLLTITPYREVSDVISGYMGIAVDLSEQKRMEQKILQQDRLASIGMLAGTLAHEIGNPMGVIRGRAELVMKQVRGVEGAEKNLEIIVNQIDRISGLIQSLLKVSRVPEKILLREVQLKPAIEEVMVLMGEALRKAKIQLHLKCLDCTVFAEPAHLQQIFLNLIINSMHAIEEQRLAVEQRSAAEQRMAATSVHEGKIEVWAELGSEKQCTVFVRDSGCGVRQQDLGHLFQPFFTTKAIGKGTGLGLAIVAKLVEEMGGRVTVQSEGVGLGATFKLDFKTP